MLEHRALPLALSRPFGRSDDRQPEALRLALGGFTKDR